MGKETKKRILGTLLVMGLGIALLPSTGIKADWENPEEISVTFECAGDADYNGELDSKDVTLLRRYLADGWGVELDETKTDVDGDKILSSKDITLLRRYIAGGWGVTINKIERHLYSDGHTENFVSDARENRWTSYYAEREDGKRFDVCTWEYDEEGRFSKEYNYDENGELEYINVDYIYDKYGRETGHRKVVGDVSYTLTYTYFEDAVEGSDIWWRWASEHSIGTDGREWQNTWYKNGNRKSETWKNADESTGEKYYRENGIRSSEYHKYNDGESEIWYCDDYGREMSCDRKDSNDNVVESREWEYDENGNRISEYHKNFRENYEEFLEWEYDKDGIVIKEICKDKPGEDAKTRYIRTNYIYDENGCESIYIEENFEENEPGIYIYSYTYYEPTDEHWYTRKTEKRVSADGKYIWEAENNEYGQRKSESWIDADGSSGEALFGENWIRIWQCNRNTDGTIEEWIWDEETGYELSWEKKDSEDNLIEYRYFEYDNEGNKVKETSMYEDGRISIRTDFEYDEYGRETGCREESGDVIYTHTYTYFEDAVEGSDLWWRWAIEYSIGTDGSERQNTWYKDGTRNSEFHKYADGESETWYYDEHGWNYSWNRIGLDGNVVESKVWEYDKDGNRINEYRIDRNGYTEYLEWEYDENGLISKETCKDKKGEDAKTIYIRTNYSYDENDCESSYIEQNLRDEEIYTCTYTYYAPDEEFDYYRRKTEKRVSADGKSIWEAENFENGDRKKETWQNADGSGGWKTYAGNWRKTGEYYYYADGSTEEVTFDDDGNDIFRLKKDSEGHTIETWANTFDSDNRRIKEAHSNYDGGWIEEVNYDVNGNQIIRVQSDIEGNVSIKIEYEYENGVKSKETRWNGNEEWMSTRTKYTFDKYGRETGYTEEANDGVIYADTFTYFEDSSEYDDYWWNWETMTSIGSDESEYYAECYKNGQKSKEIWIDSDGSRSESNYTEDGEIISEYYYDPDGYLEESFEAQFDDNGNWKSAYWENYITGDKTYLSLYNWVSENWEKLVKREYTVYADGSTLEKYWDIETDMLLYTRFGRLPSEDGED